MSKSYTWIISFQRATLELKALLSDVEEIFVVGPKSKMGIPYEMLKFFESVYDRITLLLYSTPSQLSAR